MIQSNLGYDKRGHLRRSDWGFVRTVLGEASPMVQSHSTSMPFIIPSDLTMSLKSPGPGDPIHDATQHPVRISCSSSTNLWNDIELLSLA